MPGSLPHERDGERQHHVRRDAGDRGPGDRRRRAEPRRPVRRDHRARRRRDADRQDPERTERDEQQRHVGRARGQPVGGEQQRQARDRQRRQRADEQREPTAPAPAGQHAQPRAQSLAALQRADAGQQRDRPQRRQRPEREGQDDGQREGAHEDLEGEDRHVGQRQVPRARGRGRREAPQQRDPHGHPRRRLHRADGVGPGAREVQRPARHAAFVDGRQRLPPRLAAHHEGRNM
jgi:hypothetical protein